MRRREAAAPRVLHQDGHFLVVYKPPGLPTTSPTSGGDCLVQWVAAQLPAAVRAHPTSRLDSPVSGVVTFALTSAANKHLLHARRAGLYSRSYLGVTLAQPDFERSRWSWPIAIDPRNAKLRTVGTGRGSREAETECLVIERSQSATLLRLLPHTGRTHQLRVHAATADVPLFGDHAYGGPRRVSLSDGRVVTAPRVMLHCATVCFPAIGGDGTTMFRSTVPRDMQETWSALGGSSSIWDAAT